MTNLHVIDIVDRMKKSSADYQREYRKRLRDQGLVKKEVWVLPENGKQLTVFEKELRRPQLDKNFGIEIGEENMNNTSSHRWATENLFNALKDRPAFSNGNCSIEIIDGIDSSIVTTMHTHGDLPIFITVSGEQILAEAVLFSIDDVANVADFNEYVLRTHKYLPLSTISLESDFENGDYYHMFGALSATSSINEIVFEIETLAENTIQATEAFKTFLKF